MMRKTINSLLLLASLALLPCINADAQKKKAKIDVSEALQGYFTPAAGDFAKPDSDGFIRRWMILEPISKPNPSNRVFTETYTRAELTKEYFPGQMSVIPKDGDQVTVTMEYQAPVDLSSNRPAARPQNAGSQEPKMVKAKLTWHALDSDHFFIKLFRFATGLGKDRYGVIFWTVTVINCEEDIENVRLSLGSNKAGMWWLNDEELLLVAGDRHMGVDSAVSKRVTLKKGRNVLRGATMNGPGMSEICVRFIDGDTGAPVTDYTVSCN